LENDYEKIHGLKNPNSFGFWALTIVYRQTIDWIRINKRETEKLNEYHNEQSVIEEEDNDNEHLKKELLKAIKLLSEHQQMVINLFYVEDYSLQQIGDILGISIGTAKSRLFHAREKLKTIIKQ
jgi:RNA polymerase sigma-70 factor (ECF subfamily)